MFHVFGAVDEFERGLILERTVAGLEAEKARGSRGGKPRALDEGKAKLAIRPKDEHPAEEIRSIPGAGRPTPCRCPGEGGEERAGEGGA